MCTLSSQHGGTPNLSQYTRAIPHPGQFSLPLHDADPMRTRLNPHSLPYSTWEKMTEQGRHICRYIVCDPGEEPPRNNWAPNWHKDKATDDNANAKHRGEKVDNPFSAAAAAPKL